MNLTDYSISIYYDINKTAIKQPFTQNSTNSNYLAKYDLKPIENILAVFNFSFIIFGSVGNFLTFLILIRKNVRKHSYMRYLASLCLIDTLCLYTWNFSFVYSYFNGRKIEHMGKIYCRLFSFFSYFILQSSSWVICSIGMDRIITVLFRNKLNKLAKLAKNTLLVIFTVIFVFFCFNFVVLINNAERIRPISVSSNRTYTCYEPKTFYVIWDIVHIVMYSILPFFIIFIENISLSLLTLRHAKQMNIHCKSLSYPASSSDGVFNGHLFDRLVQMFDKKKRIYRKSVNLQSNVVGTRNSSIRFWNRTLALQAKRTKKMQSKGFHVANLLLFLTVSFFFTTVPYSTFYALRLNVNMNLKAKNIVVGILTLLQYTRHSANFLIYLFTSSIIKHEIQVIFQNLKKKITTLELS